eukprot:4412673-Pyramimonas_sp.AAC.1
MSALGGFAGCPMAFARRYSCAFLPGARFLPSQRSLDKLWMRVPGWSRSVAERCSCKFDAELLATGKCNAAVVCNAWHGLCRGCSVPGGRAAAERCFGKRHAAACLRASWG